jgi:hypothetical protein
MKELISVAKEGGFYTTFDYFFGDLVREAPRITNVCSEVVSATGASGVVYGCFFGGGAVSIIVGSVVVSSGLLCRSASRRILENRV